MLFEIPVRKPFGTASSAYWENFLSEEEISTILQFPEWNNVQESKVGILSDDPNNNSNRLDYNIRRSETAWVTPNESNRFLWEKITYVISEINRRHFHFDLTGCYEPLQLSVYNENNLGCYDWHVDCSEELTVNPRKLSMSLILSDPSEYEGGELQIKSTNDTPITLESKKGRAIFFPSYMIHRVAPVTKGTRKSIVLWVSGPAFR